MPTDLDDLARRVAVELLGWSADDWAIGCSPGQRMPEYVVMRALEEMARRGWDTPHFAIYASRTLLELLRQDGANVIPEPMIEAMGATPTEAILRAALAVAKEG